MRIIKKIAPFIVFLIIILTIMGAKPNTKYKFYDFNEQLIDGQIRRPTSLYTDARQRVKFERLLRLKKSFLNDLFDTAKERVFK